MVIHIEDAVIKFKEYIIAVDETRKLLEDEGFQITSSDEFELGAEWLVTYSDKPIAEIIGNVPYMLSFKPRVEQQEVEFDDDLIKDIKMWRRFLNNMATSIIKTK